MSREGLHSVYTGLARIFSTVSRSSTAQASGSTATATAALLASRPHIFATVNASAAAASAVRAAHNPSSKVRKDRASLSDFQNILEDERRAQDSETRRRYNSLLDVSHIIPESIDSFMQVTRQLSIRSFSQGPDGVWVYHINIEAEGPLSSYVIRRRFKEFQGLYTTVKELAMRPLPPLPPSGFWTLLRGSDRTFLKQRQEGLQRILRCIEEDPVARSSNAFSQFLGRPPSSEANVGYVSLAQYSAPPQLKYQEEKQARRKYREWKKVAQKYLSKIGLPGRSNNRPALEESSRDSSVSLLAISETSPYPESPVNRSTEYRRSSPREEESPTRQSSSRGPGTKSTKKPTLKAFMGMKYMSLMVLNLAKRAYPSNNKQAKPQQRNQLVW